MSEYLRSEIVEALRHKCAAFIVGAGVSLLGTDGEAVASWAGLIESGIDRCVDLEPTLARSWQKTSLRCLKSADTAQLIALAQDIETRLKSWPGRQYEKWLSDTTGSLTLKSPQVVEALAASEAPLLTTNYDDLLEAGTGREATTWNQLAEMQSEVTDPGRSVIHLHGHWRKPDTIVFGYESYSNAIGDAASQAFLRALLTIKSVVLVGFGQGIEDPNFSALTTWLGTVLRSSGIAPVILVRNRDNTKARNRYVPLGINVISYGDEYEDLALYIADLVNDAKVLTATDPCVEFSWDAISAKLLRLQRRITRSFSPSFVVATSGPGNFAPAYCLANWSGEPPLFTAVSFPRKPTPSAESTDFQAIAKASDWLHHRSEKWDVYLPNAIRHFPKGSRALVFDDRVVGGRTQPAIAGLLKSLGYEVRCAALVVDPTCTKNVDYYEEVLAGDFVFPWGGRYGRGERSVS